MLSGTKPKIMVVLGPTSSGKSDLAVEIAKYIKKNAKRLNTRGAEIISADSRQIYKGFNLSSGKVTKKEMGGIKHYGLDLLSPSKTYSVTQYQKYAREKIKKILKENKIPIICGGAGFYINAAIYDLNFPKIKVNRILRKKLEKLSAEELYKKLKTADKKRAKTIDAKNKRRLIRALEIIYSTKKTIEPLPKNPTALFDALKIGINIPIKKLYEKIDKRLLKRDSAGMAKEINNIHKNGVSWKKLENFGLEFKWTSRYLQKKIGKNEMLAELANDIKHYAKRQITWFKKDKDINWIKTEKQAKKLVDKFIL